MNKFLSILFFALVISAGCDRYDHTPIWDMLNDHEERIAGLEDLCEQFNENIQSLQTIVAALQSNDYITSVVACMEDDKKVGYTLYFSKSGAVTIYHGKDGRDGVDGTEGAAGTDGIDGEDGIDGVDGRTPVIGVRQHEDGRYYWTLDGEWLLDDEGNMIPTTGKDGAPGQNGTDGVDGAPGEPGASGQDGTPGAPGQDGKPGADGKDGVTPKLKIEDECWYVSYDNGISWELLGRATGEDGKDGTPGQDGKNGDSMFQDVEVTDDYVVITLTDGTPFKIPTWKAFEELLEIIELVNSNVSSLQTIVSALQSNDYVTGVVPQMDGNEVVGYILTFAKSGTIVISNGTDGIDGTAPVIGVEEEDGTYYWTVDGEWMTDSNGDRIPATGRDGSEGDDGMTPRLKIENGYWYVSYDDGQTWEQLGRATGEDGDDGDDFFQSVDTSNPDFVVITLKNGTSFSLLTTTGVSQGGQDDIYASSYGVVPGVVDMEKMNALLTAAAGKTIRFNSGEYTFPAHITVPSDISFIGNTKTVFKLAKNSGSNVLFYMVGVKNVTISHMFIDGGAERVQPMGLTSDILDRTKAGNRYGIYCDRTRRIKLHDLEVLGWDLCGLYCMENESAAGEEGRFYQTVEVTNSTFYYNYYGLWNALYAEYNRIESCSFGDNFIGVLNEGGNNMYTGTFFNSNYCGFALNGDGIVNESHGGCYSCTYNHNSESGLGGGIAIYANKSTIGWNFIGQNIWYGAVTLKDCKGIIFDGNIWGEVQFSSTSSAGLKNQNIVTNTYFYTDPQNIFAGNDGSTYFDSYLPGGVPEPQQ